MLEWMKDHLYCTKNHPFKMNPEHSQPHSRRKTKRQELQAHHEPIVVGSGSGFSFLLLSYSRGRLEGPVVCQTMVNEGQMSG